MPPTIHDPALITLRPITDEDLDFLRELYATTRSDIQQAPLDNEHKNQLMQMQFDAQHQHYQKQFPAAQFDLICLKDRPIGRIYVNPDESEIRLIDIALMPEFRGHGIGSRLICQLQQKSRLDFDSHSAAC